jgi:hypothetical protein
MNRTKNLTYDPQSLSEAEREQFILALGDGFHDTGHPSQLHPSDLPAEIDSGLLRHPVHTFRFEAHGPEIVQVLNFDLIPPEWLEAVGHEADAPVPKTPRRESLEMDEGHEEVLEYNVPAFWENGIFKGCPVNFDLEKIAVYFQGQKTAYLKYARPHVDNIVLDLLPEEEKEMFIYRSTLYRPYSKSPSGDFIKDCKAFVT